MSLTPWDGLLYAVGIVIAVGTLTRLMRQRRDRLVAEVHSQLTQARERKKRKKKAAKDKAA